MYEQCLQHLSAYGQKLFRCLEHFLVTLNYYVISDVCVERIDKDPYLNKVKLIE